MRVCEDGLPVLILPLLLCVSLDRSLVAPQRGLMVYLDRSSAALRGSLHCRGTQSGDGPQCQELDGKSEAK